MIVSGSHDGLPSVRLTSAWNRSCVNSSYFRSLKEQIQEAGGEDSGRTKTPEGKDATGRGKFGNQSGTSNYLLTAMLFLFSVVVVVVFVFTL